TWNHMHSPKRSFHRIERCNHTTHPLITTWNSKNIQSRVICPYIGGGHPANEVCRPRKTQILCPGPQRGQFRAVPDHEGMCPCTVLTHQSHRVEQYVQTLITETAGGGPRAEVVRADPQPGTNLRTGRQRRQE